MYTCGHPGSIPDNNIISRRRHRERKRVQPPRNACREKRKQQRHQESRSRNVYRKRQEVRCEVNS